MQPLKGMKVLELARILAGPLIGQVLADLGATVVKVESPSGDDTRTWGPPFVERGDDKTASYFYSCNRGKQSIALDFSNPEDLDLLYGLVDEADVLIENFKLGGLKKFGLDYDSLSARNPRLIYCSVTGFGQDGPYAARAGYDYLLQGMAGLMSITGAKDGDPMRFGVAVTDVVSGLYGVIAIQAALSQRQQTGRGQHVDMSLFDSATSLLTNQASGYLASGQEPGRIGNTHPSIVPYQVFEVSDGHIIIAVGNDRQFERLCQVLGADALARTDDFATNAKRVEARSELTEKLQGYIRNWSRDALLAALEDAVVPASPINGLADVFADPQILARDLVVTPQGVPGVRSPMRFSDSVLALEKTAPRLDEHGAAIRKSGWNA